MSYDAMLAAAADRAMGGEEPSGDWEVVVERPVPLVGDPDEGFREYTVALTMDGGQVLAAEVVAEWVHVQRTCLSQRTYVAQRITGGAVSLTPDEEESACVEFSEQCEEERWDR